MPKSKKKTPKKRNSISPEKSNDVQELVEEGLDESNAAYLCSCGFSHPDRKDFSRHVMLAARQDGKGTHKSLGVADLATGQIIVPPWTERTAEQKLSFKGLKRSATESGSNGKDEGKPAGATPSRGMSPIKADSPALAQEIRVVPRVFTMDYSPIMRAAQDAAITYWGWRADMPLGNFIDTCLHMFFEEKGITLCGYLVHESYMQKEGHHAC